MSDLIKSIFTKAKQMEKRIVLPEGEDPRIIEAAISASRLGVAKITLLGCEDTIRKKAVGSLDSIEIINPRTSDRISQYSNLLYELRKSKGVTMEDAERLAKNNLYFGVLMVKNGDADGMVAGAINSTGDVLRPALQIIKAKKGINTVSSCFLMALPEGVKYGHNGVLIFADCAVNINPDARALADIALAGAQSAKAIADIPQPKVAMLSFSTKGSAKHEYADKVIEATRLAKESQPDLLIDGELQADAALVESVAWLKAPDSVIGGQANVLIFPDLQSGNIGYKLVQRLAKAEAIGPISQGLAKPVNDLSRGCSAEDVVSVIAITALQAE